METVPHPARRHTHRLPLLLAAPILTAIALTGCGAHGGGTNADATGSVARGAAVPNNLDNTGKATTDSAGGFAVESQPHSEVQQSAVISTGAIELTSSDLVATRTRLDAVLARDGGHVGDERTITDDHGNVTRSHLVLRVPSVHFDAAMTALGGVASLRSSSRQAEDVTTRVIDLQARIRAEQAGVRRLRALVSHTASLGALLNVERALTQRQGELESLQRQRAYLADQTSLATITVDITRRTAPPAPPAKAAGGFVGGLQHGWHGLVAVVDGLLVGLGTFLPFAGAALILAIPAWPLVRRLQRARRPAAPVES
jgi:Domain of unknown function (DUF4349)